MTDRIAYLAAALGLTTILGGCGTTGNFTDYVVRCDKSDTEIRSTAWSVAEVIGKARNEKADPWQNTDRILQIVISGTPIFEVLYYSPQQTEPMPPNGGYKISVDRLWHSSESPEVLNARKLVEATVQQSACPVFSKTVYTYKPSSLAH